MQRFTKLFSISIAILTIAACMTACTPKTISMGSTDFASGLESIPNEDNETKPFVTTEPEPQDPTTQTTITTEPNVDIEDILVSPSFAICGVEYAFGMNFEMLLTDFNIQEDLNNEQFEMVPPDAQLSYIIADQFNHEFTVVVVNVYDEPVALGECKISEVIFDNGIMCDENRLEISGYSCAAATIQDWIGMLGEPCTQYVVQDYDFYGWEFDNGLWIDMATSNDSVKVDSIHMLYNLYSHE